MNGVLKKQELTGSGILSQVTSLLECKRKSSEKINSKKIIDPAMAVYFCKTLSKDMIDQN